MADEDYGDDDAFYFDDDDYLYVEDDYAIAVSSYLFSPRLSLARPKIAKQDPSQPSGSCMSHLTGLSNNRHGKDLDGMWERTQITD